MMVRILKLPDYENTYFKEYSMFYHQNINWESKILLKEPRSTLSWHRDPNQDYTFQL